MKKVLEIASRKQQDQLGFGRALSRGDEGFRVVFEVELVDFEVEPGHGGGSEREESRVSNWKGGVVN